MSICFKKHRICIKKHIFVKNHGMDKIFFPTSNGVVVHADDKKVISAINCDGQKKLKSFKEKNKIIFWHFPFMRGFQFFFCGIFGFFQALLLSYDLCNANKKVKTKEINKFYTQKLIIVGLVALLAIIFSAIVLGLLPGKLGYLIVDYKGSELLRNIVIFVFKLILFFLFVLALRVFPVVVECFRFNKAGEIVLRDFEKDKEKSQKKDKNIKKIKNLNSFIVKNSNLKPNFLNYLIFVFVLDFLVVTLWGADYGFWFNIALNVAVFLVCVSLAYEILWLLNLPKCKIIGKLQYLTAFLVFDKPTTTHIETVMVAMTEINLLTSQKEREFMDDENKKAFSVVYIQVKNKLYNAGITDKSDADWIIATVLGKNRAEIKLLSFVTDKQYQEIMKATERRAKGESIDNIFGYTEFYGLRFDVNKKVLTPRMETEILVEQVLKAEKNFKNATILDLGTGSGAIAVSIAKNSDADVTAVDISKSALLTAEANAKKNDVKIEFLHSNLFDNLKRKRKFDIIVSNPPYIPTKEIEKLDKNVKECDPVLALDGGEDGLDFYRKIAEHAPLRLNQNGLIFFEVGKGQAKAVRKILRDNGFEDIKTIKDYNKIERVICGKRK